MRLSALNCGTFGHVVARLHRIHGRLSLCHVSTDNIITSRSRSLGMVSVKATNLAPSSH